MPSFMMSAKAPATSALSSSASTSGQNTLKSKLCIATKLNGMKCDEEVAHPYVPYCKSCMEKGDPSLAVLQHPKFGKMLVTKRDLPKGYKMALWGTVFLENDMPEADKEWGFETADGIFINPVPHKTSLPQFCQCPGPNERVTVSFNNPHLLMEPLAPKEKPKEKYGSMLFQTSMPVPKNHQLVMMYATNEKETEKFFAEREIERCDVWTKKNPTILKKKADEKKLKLAPSSKITATYVNSNTKPVSKEVKKSMQKTSKK